MNKCKGCGSFAINHHCHGRDGSEPDLCDVCYWRNKVDVLQRRLAGVVSLAEHLAECGGWDVKAYAEYLAAKKELENV